MAIRFGPPNIRGAEGVTSIVWLLMKPYRRRRMWFHLCLAACLWSMATHAAAQGSVETDRAVLVALYSATGGPSWTLSLGALSAEVTVRSLVVAVLAVVVLAPPTVVLADDRVALVVEEVAPDGSHGDERQVGPETADPSDTAPESTDAFHGTRRTRRGVQLRPSRSDHEHQSQAAPHSSSQAGWDSGAGPTAGPGGAGCPRQGPDRAEG